MGKTEIKKKSMESILILKNEIFKPKINEINDIKYIVYYVGISATKKK